MDILINHGLLIFSAALLGTFTQSIVGFGLPLLLVPALAWIDPQLVPGPALIASLLLSTLLTYQNRKHLIVDELSTSIWGLLLGTLIGGLGLLVMPAQHLPLLFGSMILLSVIVSGSGWHVKVTRNSLLGAGTAAGVMGTMTGMHGPPMALLYQHGSGQQLRAVMAPFMMLGNSIALIALWLINKLGIRELQLALFLLPAVIVGWLLAQWFVRHLDNTRYLRYAILLLASLSAITLIIGNGR
ncbi:MAG: sulfite exporter TauE/SafE family protein [Wenzhouxiangellaceae bacterium]